MIEEARIERWQVEELIQFAYRGLEQWDYGIAISAARKSAGILKSRLDMVGRDVAADRNLIMLFLKVGTLFVDSGMGHEGRTMLDNALDLITTLILTHPTDFDLRADLYAAHLQFGESFVVDLQGTEAKPHFRKAMDIAEQAVAEHPKDEKWQRRLGVVAMRIAHGLADQGLRSDALEPMHKARAIAEQSFEADSAQEDRQSDLAGAYLSLGCNYRKMGRWAEARDFLTRATSLIPPGKTSKRWTPVKFSIDRASTALDEDRRLGIASRLLADDPRRQGWNGSWVRTSGIINSNGKLSPNDWPAWIVSYQAEVSKLRQRLSKHLDDPDIRRDMSLMYERIGDLQLAMGRDTKALAAFEACLAWRGSLADDDAENATWQRDLALIMAKVGLAARLVGEELRARVVFSSGRTAVERVLLLDPSLTAWAEDVAWFARHLGEL